MNQGRSRDHVGADPAHQPQAQTGRPAPHRANRSIAPLARRALLRLDPVAAPNPRPWEYRTQNFLGFVQLACLVILFRRF